MQGFTIASPKEERAIRAAFLGIALSRRVFVRISREALMRAVTVMLLASGGSLVLRALG